MTRMETHHATDPRRGLYDPRHHHDACGVGFVCNIAGDPSHGVVEDALEILVNLTHRGARGCDETTGDGAGILTQIPHAFIRKVWDGPSPPEPGRYGTGLVFLPPDDDQAR